MMITFYFKQSNMIFKKHEENDSIFTSIFIHFVLLFVSFQAFSCYFLSVWRTSHPFLVDGPICDRLLVFFT